MVGAIRRGHPRYSRNEVLADALIHVLGLAGAVMAAGVLLSLAAATGQPHAVAATLVYSLTLVLMPCVSGAYHLSTDPVWSPRLRRLDQATIFVLIAASYTPFALLAIGGVLGFGLLAFVWAVAAAGVALKLAHPAGLEARVSVVLYLALGWCGVVVLPVLLEVMPARTLGLLAAGGVLYSIGVVFHLWDRLPYQNAIWHGFVVVAATCHVLAIRQLLG